ncbi:two-component regulator propeller domain-containing protein [Ulvibacterium sp.]|uniref:two-component regulator propeller domain-containing protein n=1 Tax=Ulvibacterium sp. TaxID=2665914 RepID=UPI003BAA4E5E
MKQELQNDASLNSNSIRSLYQDKEQILWVGTFGGGINKYDSHQLQFKHYKHSPENTHSLSENSVRGILLDSKGRLWVGTHGGLNCMDKATGEVEIYRYNPRDETSISSNTVRSFCEDSTGTIWAGTWINGLNRFDEKTKKFKRYYRLPGQKDSINQVRTLIADSQNNIWIGGYGLWKFNPTTEESQVFFYDPNLAKRITAHSINILYFDKKGLLWVGTKDGLNCLDTVKNSIEKYPYNPKNCLGLSHEYVTSIAEDGSGYIWVGTYGGGLNRLDTNTGVFEHYTTANGLLNDVIYGILVDEKNRVWFTSNAGLSQFDSSSGEFKHFNVSHGIQDNEFNAGAYFRSKEGEFFFGGINGLNAFDPLSINPAVKASTIVFTDFQLLGEKNNSPDANTHVLDIPISRADTIRLKHNQNNMSFGFAELNYADDVNHTYEYQLEGLSNDWNLTGEGQQVILGNIDPGTYTLNTRAVHDVSEMASITIVIAPPFWKSNWAYILYFLMLLASGLLLHGYFTQIQRKRKLFKSKIGALEADVKQLTKIQSNPNTLPLKQIKAPSEDQKTVQRALEVVEEHLVDPNFDIGSFAAHMHMSKSQLYRKLKTYTGCSPTRFIRLIRLKKAAQLLEANVGSITEIAYMVGFDNVGYFSKCFTETFGTPPSQYKP